MTTKRREVIAHLTNTQHRIYSPDWEAFERYEDDLLNWLDLNGIADYTGWIHATVLSEQEKASCGMRLGWEPYDCEKPSLVPPADVTPLSAVAQIESYPSA